MSYIMQSTQKVNVNEQINDQQRRIRKALARVHMSKFLPLKENSKNT